MRLIDADALASVLGIHEDCDDCENHESGLFCKKGGDFVTACEAIYDAPTIEPERKEITYCKDCKYYRTADCYIHIERLWELKPTDYCSQAERD